MDHTEYIPGVCNINQAEVTYRKKAMWIGYALAAVIFVVLAVLNVGPWLRAAALFVPLYIGIIGTLQVRNRFCVSYGATGKQNADNGNVAAHTVTDADARSADKQKARIMNLQALAATVAVLLATIFV